MSAPAIETARLFGRACERQGLNPQWVFEWLKRQHDPCKYGLWFGTDEFRAMVFADWLQASAPGDRQLLLHAVWSVVREGFKADPDKLDTCGVLFGSKGLEGYFGRLLREDRVLLHPSLTGLGCEVERALDTLATAGWVFRKDLLRPCDELYTAIDRAEAERVTLSPKGACNALAGGDVVAGDLLYQARFWRPKTERRRDDTLRWSRTTRPQWCAETGLTRHQYDRALSILKARGLVETRQYLPGGRTVGPEDHHGITHLRVITYIAQGPRIEL